MSVILQKKWSLLGSIAFFGLAIMIGVLLAKKAGMTPGDVVQLEVALITLWVTIVIALIGLQLQADQSESSDVMRLLELWAGQCDEAVTLLTIRMGEHCQSGSMMLSSAFDLCSWDTGEPKDEDTRRAKMILNSFASDVQLMFPEGLPVYLRSQASAQRKMLARRAIHWLMLMEPLNYVWSVSRNKNDRANRALIMDELAGEDFFGKGICPGVMHNVSRQTAFHEFAAAVGLGYKAHMYNMEPGLKYMLSEQA